MKQIDAILWDYGNVLVRWSPRAFYETVIDDEEKLNFFLENVCTMKWHHLHDSGISMDITIPALQKEFPQFSREIQMWRDNFGDMILGEIESSVKIVRKLFEMGIPQYVLTNMPSEVVDICFEPFDIKKYFKDIIVSGDEKMAKPDPSIFSLSLNRMGDIAPQRVLFTDDSAPNIKTAQEIGFQTHLFADEFGLEKKLIKLGVFDEI